MCRVLLEGKRVHRTCGCCFSGQLQGEVSLLPRRHRAILPLVLQLTLTGESFDDAFKYTTMMSCSACDMHSAIMLPFHSSSIYQMHAGFSMTLDTSGSAARSSHHVTIMCHVASGCCTLSRWPSTSRSQTAQSLFSSCHLCQLSSQDEWHAGTAGLLGLYAH